MNMLVCFIDLGIMLGFIVLDIYECNLLLGFGIAQLCCLNIDYCFIAYKLADPLVHIYNFVLMVKYMMKKMILGHYIGLVFYLSHSILKNIELDNLSELQLLHWKTILLISFIHYVYPHYEFKYFN
jgi:hypothetical protein